MIQLYTRRTLTLQRGARRSFPRDRARPSRSRDKRGAIAQLGERFNGIEEVVGSIPSGSTKISNKFNHLEKRPRRARVQNTINGSQTVFFCSLSVYGWSIALELSYRCGEWTKRFKTQSQKENVKPRQS